MPINFNEKLTELLKSHPDFIDESGELLPAAVKDHAWKLDHNLIRLLLSDPDIKTTFFDEIEGHWIFNYDKFIKYITAKNFLANSYTQFRNKIGLNIDGKFLRERGEVSLAWPYKDCVLEGGQTKEEEKREEIFFNEILAQDEINRMFDPKVLTNWKRHTATGEQDVTDIERDDNGAVRENLIIKGNNLIALHTLKQQFLGQIKLIYIDPPYNTGTDSFGYNDSFNHSSWLTFMKNRLEIAKELLRNDGVIFLQCDDNEAAYLKVLMDEVFEDAIYATTIYVQVRYGQKTLSEKNDYQKLIEQIHIYHKKAFTPIKPTEEYSIEKFVWEIVEKSNGQKLELGSKSAVLFKPGEYEIKQKEASLTGLKETWATGTVLKNNASGKFFGSYIAPRTATDGLGCLYKVEGIGKDGLGYRYFTGPKRRGATKGKFYSGIPISRLEELQSGESKKELVIPNFYNFADSFGNCRHEGGVELRSGKKPEVLLKLIIEMTTKEDDIVLDFFCGTGTTLAVAHKLNRAYIGIEQLDYHENDSVTRLKNVIEGDRTGISNEVGFNGGGDFIHCELTAYNQAYMDKIQAVQSSEELVALWKDIAENSFLNWYVNAEMPQEAVDDFTAIDDLEAQKHLLVELLDKNQLYVNLSEIDDADFDVSAEDKELNHKFYKK
ncbi:DNA methylase [Candidatus Poribacteria bacterium]|nr:MAG: DNA methylase [Candidatus Poribacteria bacterium]